MSGTEAAQAEIVEEFAFFDDWMDRYQYIIDLGKRLPGVTDEQKSEENRLHGCQSQVWLVVEGDADSLHFNADSDSAIVKGLIALVLRVYSDRSAREIVDCKPTFVEKIGLKSHLSPTRSNGLHSMLEAIRGQAARSLAEA